MTATPQSKKPASIEPESTHTTTVTTFAPLTIGLLVLAAILVVAIIVLGVTLLGQVEEVEDNQELSEVLVDFSERPYTAVQRDVLRLATIIEDEESSTTDIRNLRTIITNHMTALTSSIQIRVRTETVNEATFALQSLWASDTQDAITQYVGSQERDEAERDAVIASLDTFEQELDAISRQNEVDRQERASELEDSTTNVLDAMRNILIGLGATGALLILFGAGVALSIARSTQEVVKLNSVLDQRVRDRTRDLQTATDVSQQVATLLNLDDLVKWVATETIKSYELDAILIGLVDEDAQVINQVFGTLKGNQAINVADISAINVDARPSVIARAIRERDTVLVPDVTSSPDYLALPTLTDFKAEAVIPMIVGDKAVGMFDLYATNADKFSPAVLNALRIVANQTAVAVQNANLFAETTRARQEAETANRAKSQFLAAMSHELRTPMNSVLNFTQFVASGMLGDVTPEQKDALDKSYGSGEHLLNLINDVLDISKIESDALQLYVEDDVNLKDILKAVQDTADGLLKGNENVTFTIEQPDDIPLILGDKQRIRQILINLVSNACKFTTEGSVTVLVEPPDDTNIRILVKDTGPGISPTQQEQIFELFNQTQVGLRKGGGTGLGLPIAKRLAEAHEGTLTVESEVGTGATFILTLPIKPASLQKILQEQEGDDA